MGAWSAENATKAYLKTMKLGKNAKEPNGAEFISALAAGNNAQLVIIACATIVDYTTLALVAAAQQTGGRVICILRGEEELHISEKITGSNNATQVEFVLGDAEAILSNRYNEADFLAIDCNLENYDGILRAIQGSTRQNNTIVLGYNAFCKGSWRKSGQHTQLLPIGDGLLITRMAANSRTVHQKRSHWVVKVDKCTGEEHVFRVRSPPARFAKA
ncbi:OLC1v1027231C1 [Oldenlandia corymbosa var. corymbosa]|uniref:OLC1v1027231C1 n=1 Tax=Oldenlandia corymbosa var. corymbosa TaxID=529605 RepID=A0AAV1CC05_OLDCO|nr:OLC1v1027231C1 [Oldenlandia corymbosa var. corymbosa]